MNKILLFSVSAFFALSGMAQPVLNEEHFSDADESYVFSTTLDLNIDYSSTGANYNWDFSDLTMDSQRWLVNRPMSEASQLSNLFFGAFTSTPYKASYFALATDLPLDEWTSSLPISIDEISMFTKNTSTSINSIGYEFVISGQGVPAKSDTIEHRYDLPLEYGDSYASRGYTNLDLTPFYEAEWRQHRHRVSSVDGWGTVQTPWGTFDALRVHHRIEEVDSFYVTFSGNGIWIPFPVPASHIYEWRSTADKEPVMTIKTSEVMGDEVVTAVEYRDDYLGVNETEIGLNVYPNPVMDELQFELNATGKYLSIIDNRGKVVHQSAIDGMKGSVQIANFAPGTYHLVIVTEAGVTSTEFVKQ